EDCLREDLKALSDLEFVDVLGADKLPASLRLRVWFTQEEKPDEYECFDITIIVVVGKILKEDPRYEAVLDTYALAGVALRDLNHMCDKIALRFDEKILSVLKKIHNSPKPGD
ncbi:MAG: hypothetical protein HY912_03880, partial [Desulfomonile tiedjei]|nr:hypothetical protein [Desulfomonile tiedjei]